MKNITYTEGNGIHYPNLAPPEQTNYSLGKYANLRLDFMKKHRIKDDIIYHIKRDALMNDLINKITK